MRRSIAAFVLAAAAGLGSTGAHAASASLADLIGGGTLTEADIVFSGFMFTDRFDTDTPFAGDRPVSADQIDLSTSSTATTVTLTATVTPSISIAGQDAASGLEHIFEFFLDVSAAVSAPSTRQIIGVGLGGGDLFGTGGGDSEVVYAPGGFGSGGGVVELFEFDGTSQTTDFLVLAGLTSLLLEGQIEGETRTGETAGLSTFSLTLTMDQALTPPPAPIPLPASAVLLLGGLAGLGAVARRRRRS